MKKKLLSLFLALCMILSTAVTLGVTTFATEPAATVSADTFANATSGSTITLMNKADFLLFAANASQVKNGVTVKLGADITVNENLDAKTMTPEALEGKTTWSASIGFGASGSTPTFDGDGKTISGLCLKTAMFGHLWGTFKNVNFDNTYLYYSGINQGGSIISQVLRPSGLIDNVHMTNTYMNVAAGSSGNSYVGAFSAMPFGGSIKNSTFDGQITVTANGAAPRVGAFVGQFCNNAATLTNCVNNGKIEVNSTSAYVGGLVGEVNSNCPSLTVSNCANNGDITANGYWTAGIVGYAQKAVSMTNTVSNADIVSTNNAGGLIARGTETITMIGCAFLGSVNAGTANAGGLVGTGAGVLAATDCLSMGSVSGTASAGAYIGFPWAEGNTATTCLAISTLPDSGNNPTRLTATNCVTLAPEAVAEMSAAELMSTLWNAGFDFDEKWCITAEGAIPAALFDGEKATPDATKEIVYKGYQEKLTDGTDATLSLRLVAGLNELLYANTGFELYVMTADDMVTTTEPHTTETVYTSLVAYSEDGTVRSRNGNRVGRCLSLRNYG